jgi:hypothetical protein
MRAVVVYESMFGNTRQIAESIADGLGTGTEVQVIGVSQADRATLRGVDLLVVGGPTHARGMSRRATRRGAPDYLAKPGSDLVLEPGADAGPGVREWLPSLGDLTMKTAAFDTRIKAPPALTGRASRGIANALSRRGQTVIVPAESFLVDKKGHLLDGETERARAWGARLALVVAPGTDSPTGRGR